MKVRKLGSAIAVLFLVLTLTGCNISIVSSFQNFGSAMTGRYYYYTGEKTKNTELALGETLNIDYSVRVNKGTLELRLLDPNGEIVWEQEFDSDAKDTIGYTALSSGRHTLVLVGSKTSGSYELKLNTSS